MGESGKGAIGSAVPSPERTEVRTHLYTITFPLDTHRFSHCRTHQPQPMNLHNRKRLLAPYTDAGRGWGFGSLERGRRGTLCTGGRRHMSRRNWRTFVAMATDQPYSANQQGPLFELVRPQIPRPIPSSSSEDLP